MIYRIAHVQDKANKGYYWYIVEKRVMLPVSPVAYKYIPVYQGNEILLWESPELAAAYLCGLDTHNNIKMHTAINTLVHDAEVTV